jgi:hypothetical protein
MHATQREWWRAVALGLAALVTFAVSETAGGYRWPAGLLIGILVGATVFIAQWFVVARRGAERAVDRPCRRTGAGPVRYRCRQARSARS